jgi:nucleotide-binding universal stress UspA family protein
MVWLRDSWARKQAEISASALGEGASGDILVVLCGDPLDSTLVFLGCQMAKGAGRKVHLVHVIKVPYTLPLNAIVAQESEKADKLLNSAMEMAERIGCQAIAAMVQARAAGPAIVDEARDHHCALIFLGSVYSKNQRQSVMDSTVSYVLDHAPCRVWLVQDPQTEKHNAKKRMEKCS